MTKIYCFSGSGHSMAIADALSQILECDVTEISSDSNASSAEDTAVVIFPVYCQNIPAPVKRFLKTFRSKYVVLIASYGKISYGNVLYEAQKLVKSPVIAGAYIPIGHTFLEGNYTFDKKHLLPIAGRIQAPQTVQIPKTRKNLLANIFPALRSRLGAKIVKSDRCTNCGLCSQLCPMDAIQNGTTNSNCIRCLRCVTNCPQHALQYKNSWILNKYLNSYRKEEYVLFL